MARIQIDGRDIEADPRHNLLQVALAHGFNLPYFCWHPALGSVGACRQCAVKQFSSPEDQQGRLVMACMTPATENTRISVADTEAATFRARVIEWMMTNHPHDCPVCEEGGECHLQDMTVMTGHAYRRYRFTKRTHRNQYLGPFVKHEMNRCIACYRCVRFYRDYAGGDDLDVYAAHNDVYFGREADGVLHSPFSGNLVEVCPTGVFTDKTLSAAYNRKWDLRSAPSICVHCGHGCNTQVSERGGQVRRILNRFHAQVNGYFLCDRGRFGYGFTNDAHRPNVPMMRDGSGVLRVTPKKLVLEHLADVARGPGHIIGIGSPRASLEANFCLRELVGADHFFAGIAAAEADCLADILGAYRAGLPAARLEEIETADAVLVLGEDVANTAPRLALALRQAARSAAQAVANRLKLSPWQDAAIRTAAQDASAPLFIASPFPTPLDDIAHTVLRMTPAQMVEFARALDQALTGPTPGDDGEVATIARILRAAKNPLIVAGCALGVRALPASAAMIVQRLRAQNIDARLTFAVPECNSLGLAIMEPDNIEAALQAAAQPDIAAVIVLENDLVRRAPPHAASALFSRKTPLVVLDHVQTATTARADFLLPCGNFAECEGSYVNAEGRAQRGFPAAKLPDEAAPAWMWLRDIAAAIGRPVPPADFDGVMLKLSAALPAFAGIPAAAPGADFRIAGRRLRSEPHRYTGRTAVDAARTVFEPKAFRPEAAPFTGTMEGYYGPMPAALYPFFWAPGWNSGQSLHKFQEESGALRSGPAGVRLFDNGAAGMQAVPATPPEPEPPPEPEHTNGAFLLLPQQHVFGSEELSARAAPVAELISPAALSVNAADAGRLGLQQDMPASLSIGPDTLRLNVNIVAGLSAGTATVSAGWPQTAWLCGPVRATLRRADGEEVGP
ncbi:MAG TPA: NADH-quinone oxidoreductase subunit NuoG [Acidocella sp.]|jgi:NADH-quinone oxidoreductase subunit G|nr:NADH-quinone oxidoreductase subunit NuoG [Acidocella sp.]